MGTDLNRHRLARLAIRSRLFPIGLDRRSFGQPVIFSREIGQQNGRVAACHRDRQRPHLGGTIAPMLRVVGIAWRHRTVPYGSCVEPVELFKRGPEMDSAPLITR
jgi:hypothetical protein